MDNIAQILRILPERVKCEVSDIIKRNGLVYSKLTEIHLRINQSVIVKYEYGKEYIIGNIHITSEDINYCLQMITKYSIYAYQDSIRMGFVTVKGGHRVGVMGQAIVENGTISGQKNITFVNIRVAHQVLGCAKNVIPFICDSSVHNTLIISPPNCGKTTLLRDIIRNISNGIDCIPRKVALIDERSEIAASFEGIPQNDVGQRTDVLDLAPKSQGMILALRAMSPEVIAIDELGGVQDIDAVKQVIHCGCKVIATIHGYDLQDCYNRKELKEIIGHNGFTKIIVLSGKKGVGTIESMVNT